MAESIPITISPATTFFSNSIPPSSHLLRPFRRQILPISCYAVAGTGPASSSTTPTMKKNKIKKNRYEMENLTTWLLKQEQAGQIDAELTIVLSSISLACKQIASLLQRSSIINITGAQGTMNIQGEDQKKLDVISNEVCSTSLFSVFQFSS